MSKDTHVIKMHHFAIVEKESYKKGTMRKIGSGTIMRIADEDCWVYECGKCLTKFQIAQRMPIAQVNKEVTLRLPCL